MLFSLSILLRTLPTSFLSLKHKYTVYFCICKISKEVIKENCVSFYYSPGLKSSRGSHMLKMTIRDGCEVITLIKHRSVEEPYSLILVLWKTNSCYFRSTATNNHRPVHDAKALHITQLWQISTSVYTAQLWKSPLQISFKIVSNIYCKIPYIRWFKIRILVICKIRCKIGLSVQFGVKLGLMLHCLVMKFFTNLQWISALLCCFVRLACCLTLWWWWYLYNCAKSIYHRWMTKQQAVSFQVIDNPTTWWWAKALWSQRAVAMIML